MTKLLDKYNVVVTGCNRGIGHAIIELFANHGANIFACLRKEDEAVLASLNQLASRNQVEITPIYFDLNNEEEVKAASKEIMQTKKQIDVLVNNAGAIFVGPYHLTSMEKYREMMEINFFSQMLFTQNIARLMCKNRKGSIIHISSSAALEGNEGRVAYAAAKSALIASSKVMSRELGAFNVRVNVLAPGLTQTEMMTLSTKEDVIRETLARTALKRVGTPEEIAQSVLFLASHLSTYVTGQILRVDGGM